MEYRVLVDENTSPRVAETLRGDGITLRAVTEETREVLHELKEPDQTYDDLLRQLAHSAGGATSNDAFRSWKTRIETG